MMRNVLGTLIALALASGVAWAGAPLEQKVIVYSPHGQDMLTDMADQFKKETGIQMEFLVMGGGEIVDRLRAEKDNPQADIMYGNPSSVFVELKQEGLFQVFIPTWAKALDPYFKDSDGTWFGTIQTPVFIFYNNKILSAANAPKDWWDLIDPKYRDQLIFRSTTSAASRVTFASLIYQFDKKGTLQSAGWDFFRKLDANTKRHVANSALMFQAIARGEASMGFWILSDITDSVTKNNMPLTIVNAVSGSPVITDAIAIVKGAKHLEAAKKFVEFAGRPDMQAQLADKFNRMPTHPQALKQAPAWMKQLTYKMMDVDWMRLSQKQSEWLQYYEDNIRDAAKVQK
jgi:iron(III) transport system substrate-binding protein